MIWGDSGYTSSPNIEALLGQEEVNLNELLDDEDIIQECKSQNKKLIQYLVQPNVIDELVTIITTEPASDLQETIRFKHANVACEILTSDVPSLYNRLVSDDKTLQKLYDFIKQEPPLNPLLASFFCKTFNSLVSRRGEQNWFSYHSVVHQVFEFIKAKDDFFDMILKHISMPVVMDLLFHILTQIEEPETKTALLDYVNEKFLFQKLIMILSERNETEKHNNIAQFLSEIIKTGRSIRQDDRQDRPANTHDPILDVLESENTSKLILDTILNENSSESGIVAGIKVILTLFENPIVNEPVSDTALQYLIDSEKDHHKNVVLGLVNSIIPTIKKFHEILLNPPEKVASTDVVNVIPPFGNTRLHICSLFTVLMETDNKEILNAICDVDYFNTLLKLFKEYCWNNFLHNQVKKCLTYAFQSFEAAPYLVAANDSSDENEQAGGDAAATASFDAEKENHSSSSSPLQQHQEQELVFVPSALQKHIFEHCKIISKLLDCWQHNETMQSQEKGRRLGYMGHLIEILSQLIYYISETEKLRALFESSVNDSDRELWNKLIDPDTGDLTNQIKVQCRFLANCNPNNKHSMSYDIDVNLQDLIPNMPDMSKEDIENAHKMLSFSLGPDVWDDGNDDLNELTSSLNRQLKVWSNDADDLSKEDSTIEFGTIIGDDPWKSSENDPWSLDYSNPWGGDIEPDPLQGIDGPDPTSNDIDNWASFELNNFADFDKHFTDFEPVSTNVSNTIAKPIGSDAGDQFLPTFSNTLGPGAIISDDDKSKIVSNTKRMVTKNLIPGADGRLVLETTVIQCENKSDKNANIHTTDSQDRDETELDNHRNSLPGPNGEEVSMSNIVEAHSMLISNGPKSEVDEISSSTGITSPPTATNSSLLENDSDSKITKTPTAIAADASTTTTTTILNNETPPSPTTTKDVD